MQKKQLVRKNWLLAQKRLFCNGAWSNLQRHAQHRNGLFCPNGPHFCLSWKSDRPTPSHLRSSSHLPVDAPHSHRTTRYCTILHPYYIVVLDLPFLPLTSTNISCRCHIHLIISTADRQVSIIYVLKPNYHVITVSIPTYCSFVTSGSTSDISFQNTFPTAASS